MSVVAFTPRENSPRMVRQAVAEASARFPKWTIEPVEADDGALSVAAESERGAFVAFHPAGSRWARVDLEGRADGVFSSLADAFAASFR